MCHKNEVITLINKVGKKTTYLWLSSSDNNKNNFQLQHKLRIKQIIYGHIFTYYHPQMDFTFCLNNGCKIITDNRILEIVSFVAC